MAQEQSGGGAGNYMLSKVEDAVGGVVGKLSAATTGSVKAEAFVANASISNLYEMKAAEIALQRSASEEVREFAQMLLDEHRVMPNRLEGFIAEAGSHAKPQHELDHRRNGMINNLMEASPEGFDRMFIDQQVMAHEEALTLFRGYGENGDDPELRRFANECVPMLEKHHYEAVRLRGS